MMTKQEELIGSHPKSGIFNYWIKCTDTSCSTCKTHRMLEELASDDNVVEVIGKWLIDHHLSEGKKFRLNTKKRILEKYDFEEYAKNMELFPVTDKTRKGNLAEVVLCEYLQETSGAENYVYRLHFNPNIDQSMKGDDVLLFKVDKEIEVYVGESKFRKTSSKASIKSVSENYGSELTLPISLTFVADRLFDVGNIDIAGKLFDLNDSLYKNTENVVNVGFIMSDNNIGTRVEKHMDSKNSKFILISMGLTQPEILIEKSYTKAKNLVSGDKYGL